MRSEERAMVAPSLRRNDGAPAELGPTRARRRAAADHAGRAGRLFRSAARSAALSLLLSLLLPIAVAVAQDDDDEAAEGDPPAGDYTVAITQDDIPTDLVNGPDLIGRWQIILAPDGAYSLVRADLGQVVTGSYEVEDETITLTDEGGLLSCVNALPTAGVEAGTETGSYTWELDDRDGLTLRPIQDGCAGRRLILTTRTLDFFVACETEAVAIAPPTGEDDLPIVAGQEAEEEIEDEGEEGTQEGEAGEEGEDGDDRVLDDPFGDGEENGEENGGDGEEPTQEEAEEGIDAVLDQLSACWTTQDPARILPLFGTAFLDQLVEDLGSLYDAAGIFGQIMAIPITWERAGDVNLDGTNATALVSQTIGAEESFVRFLFVFEDGEWKLASFG
jgi:hypothetical protein